MNGTPEKHSFSSSEEKERKTEGGGGQRVRWKVKTGWDLGGGSRHGEYIFLLHSSTVTGRNVTRRQQEEMHRWRKVNLHRSSPLNMLLLSKSSSQKGHSDHSSNQLIMKMRLVSPAEEAQQMAAPSLHNSGSGPLKFILIHSVLCGNNELYANYKNSGGE